MSDEWATEVDDVPTKLFMVLFSAPNAGKTILASRIAKEVGKSLIITDEAGHRALNDFPDLKSNTKIRQFASTNDFEVALQKRRQGLMDFETIIVDTFTGIQKMVLKQYMNPSFQGYLDVKRNHPAVPATQDYLLAENIWSPVIQRLAVQNEVNIILNCHIRHPNTDKIIPGDKTRPKLPDAIFELVNGKANVVAFMDRIEGEEERRFVSTHSTNKIVGKSQIRDITRPMSDDDFIERITKWLLQ